MPKFTLDIASPTPHPRPPPSPSPQQALKSPVSLEFTTNRKKGFSDLGFSYETGFILLLVVSVYKVTF